eukprot:5318843-Prorocentrum_lima.AAC.1
MLVAWVGDRVFAHGQLLKSRDELGIMAPLFRVEQAVQPQANDGDGVDHTHSGAHSATDLCTN